MGFFAGILLGFFLGILTLALMTVQYAKDHDFINGEWVKRDGAS